MREAGCSGCARRPRESVAVQFRHAGTRVRRESIPWLINQKWPHPVGQFFGFLKWLPCGLSRQS